MSLKLPNLISTLFACQETENSLKVTLEDVGSLHGVKTRRDRGRWIFQYCPGLFYINA